MDPLRKARRDGLPLSHIATMRAYAVAKSWRTVLPTVDLLAQHWFLHYANVDIDALTPLIVPDMDWVRHRIAVGEIRPLHGRKHYQSSQEEVRWTWK